MTVCPICGQRGEGGHACYEERARLIFGDVMEADRMAMGGGSIFIEKALLKAREEGRRAGRREGQEEMRERAAKRAEREAEMWERDGNGPENAIRLAAAAIRALEVKE